MRKAELLVGTFIFMLSLICALIKTNPKSVAEKSSPTLASKESIQVRQTQKETVVYRLVCVLGGTTT